MVGFLHIIGHKLRKTILSSPLHLSPANQRDSGCVDSAIVCSLMPGPPGWLAGEEESGTQVGRCFWSEDNWKSLWAKIVFFALEIQNNDHTE